MIEPTTALIDKIFERCEFLDELKISRREVYRIICEWENIKERKFHIFNKQAEIFLHKLAIAHLQKDGSGKIPPEMADFVNGCFTNGIELEIKEK